MTDTHEQPEEQARSFHMPSKATHCCTVGCRRITLQGHCKQHRSEDDDFGRVLPGERGIRVRSRKIPLFFNPQKSGGYSRK
jgi:hypothetical protein